MSTPTDSTQSSTRKRKLLTLKTKLNIINRFQCGEKVSQISKNLSLPNSTVGSIIRDKKRILAACKNDSVLNSSTIIRKRHGLIAQMECQLKTWCEEQAEQNIRLTQSDICAQARNIFEAMKRDYGEAAKCDTFSASKGWYSRFKRRCEGSRISDLPEEEPQEAEVEEEPQVKVKKEKKKEKTSQFHHGDNIESSFPNHIKMVIEEGGYTPQTIFNVDEIGLYWKKMPERSNLYHLDQMNFNESKDRLTILLGGNAAGDLKLNPLLIYRIENPRALHNKSKGGLPVVWKSNPKASMTASLFEEWFGNYFIPEVERYCYANNIPCKVLLILDTAVYHPPLTLVDFDHRINVVFLPPGEVNAIQPMNQEISSIFKALYTRQVFAHILEITRFSNVVTVEEVWKDFNILDALRIIVDSWAGLLENVWRSSWRELCPSLFEAHTTTRVSEIVEEVFNIAQELDMKIERKDINDLLDSHKREPTIEELIEMQEYSANEELDIQDPLLAEGPMTVENLTEAFSHIKMGLQILENIDSNEQRARTTRIGVTKLLSAYEEILNEKIKLIARQDTSMDGASSSHK